MTSPRFTRKKRKASQPLAIGEIIGPALSQRGLEGEYHQWQVLSLWDQVVGKPIADQTQAVKINRGTLTVRVSHSTWMQELQFIKEDLKNRLNREIDQLGASQKGQLPLYLSPIKSIRFQLGTIQKP